MCLILHCLNETYDLFNITAAQTVENNARQRMLLALFGPLLVVGIFMSHINSVVCWVFSTILTLHTHCIAIVYLQDHHICCFQFFITCRDIESHTHLDHSLIIPEVEALISTLVLKTAKSPAQLRHLRLGVLAPISHLTAGSLSRLVTTSGFSVMTTLSNAS